MEKWLYLLYVSYLGKHKGIRLDAIIKLVKDYDGKEFFNKYSTPNDSILDFLKRCEKEGIEL